MWDLFTTVRNRHSIRKYQSDMPVEPEKLHAILEMACAAPSAGDLQAYKIIVVTNQDKRDRLSEAANNQTFISEAPVCLVFYSDENKSMEKFGDKGKNLYALQDATIAAAYAQLAIVAAGLASTWVGFFDEQKIEDILVMGNGLKPVAMLSLGYPAEIPETSTRQNMDEIIINAD